MEQQLFGLWAALLAVVLLGAVDSGALSLPQANENDLLQLHSSEASQDVDSRATWLDTRDVQVKFKEMVFMSLQELASEGRIDASIVKDTLKPKRGRFQGFCFRKLRNGRYMPYICWKGDRK